MLGHIHIVVQILLLYIMTESRSFLLNYFKSLGIFVEHMSFVHQSDEHNGSPGKE